MKLILTNVTYGNLNAIKALVLVATNLVPTATQYEPDFYDARYKKGYRELYNAYYAVPWKEREDFVPAANPFVPAANPFEPGTPEANGYNDALADVKANRLERLLPITRWRLEATGSSPADTSLLLRFAHTLGKTYRNVDVTIED